MAQITFDAKRDRWLGYHPDQHKETIERYQMLDQERRRARREAAEKQEERRKASRVDSGQVGSEIVCVRRSVRIDVRQERYVDVWS